MCGFPMPINVLGLARDTVFWAKESAPDKSDDWITDKPDWLQWEPITMALGIGSKFISRS